MIIEKSGDVFTSEMKCIGHGVNCFGKMDHGIAVQVKEKYPAVFRMYEKLCKEEVVLPGTAVGIYGGDKIIVNIASQFQPGPHAELELLETGMLEAKAFCEAYGFKGMAIPRIGSGVGALEWEDVSSLLHELFDEDSFVLEVWDYTSVES